MFAVTADIRWLDTIRGFYLQDPAAFTKAVRNTQLGEPFNVGFHDSDGQERCMIVRLVYICRGKAIVQEYFGDEPQNTFFVLYPVGITWEGAGYRVSLLARQNRAALLASLVSR